MAHSPAYFLAAGVADHEFFWSHATEAKITDLVIHQLIDTVQVGTQPTQEVEEYKQGASVIIQTKDGRTFSSTVFAPKGAGALGIDWADVDAKYRTDTGSWIERPTDRRKSGSDPQLRQR